MTIVIPKAITIKLLILNTTVTNPTSYAIEHVNTIKSITFEGCDCKKHEYNVMKETQEETKQTLCSMIPFSDFTNCEAFESNISHAETKKVSES